MGLHLHKSDNNNQMIQLTDNFCVLFKYIIGSILSEDNERLIILSVIQAEGSVLKTAFSENLNLT